MKKIEPLTISRIASTVATDREVWLSDGNGMRGAGRLLLRILPSGSRRFYFRHSKKGIRTTVCFGPYSKNRKDGSLTLEEARALALKHAGTLILPTGTDSTLPRLLGVVQEPVERNSASTLQSGRAATGSTSHADIEHSFLDLCNSYVKGLEEQEKISARDYRGLVKLYIASSSLAALPAREVTSSQIVELLRQIVDADKGRTAGKLRSMVAAAFARAMSAEVDPTASKSLLGFNIQRNPVTGVASLSKYSRAGDRFLNLTELTAFWRRLCPADKTLLTLPMRAVRLAFLLGGQRNEQLLRVPLSQVDVKSESIVLYDPKGRRPKPRKHELPLVDMAKDDVIWLLQHSKDVGSDYLFAGRGGKKPLGKGSVSKTVARISKSMLAAGEITTPFGYGDLRRTVTTTLPSLGVSTDISNQLQSHDLGGVTMRHYNRYSYMEQKRAALIVWQDFLVALGAQDSDPAR